VISLRWIVAGAGFAITVLIVLAMGGVSEREQRRALTRELESRLALSARNLAMTSSRALLSDFPELTLAPILSEMAQAQPEQAFAVVADLDSEIRGHAEARLLGTPFALPGTLRPRPTVVALRRDEQMLGDDEILVVAAPVTHPAGHRIGTAYVAFRRDHVESVIAGARRAQGTVVLAALALGTLVVPLVISRLLRPLGALREGLERIGRGDLETPIRLRSRTELALLAETVNEMAGRIREAQQERVERERLAREMELARDIQASLLPAGGLTAGAFRVEGSHRAAAEVGGDYYDVFPLPGGRVGLAVADVAGKGLGGCLVSFMLAALLRAYREGEPSPRNLLVRLDEALRGSLRPGMFVTMFYGILDPADGSLVFASAGHSPLLVRRATGAAEWRRTKGVPIGAVRGNALARTLAEERVVLGPGDVAVQFTDGVNEAFDPSGERQFGFEGLQAAVEAAAADGPGGILSRVRRDIDAFTRGGPPHDDETMLVVSASSPARGDPTDPLAVLAEARRRGHGTEFPADLDALARIHEWAKGCPELTGLDARCASLVETALYEVCANIAEHGYGKDARRSLELYWLPARVAPGIAGEFVLVDHGRPFAPPESSVDFRDPSVRRRGRGLGLEIVRGAMRHVSYHPATEAGNVTILSFDCTKIRSAEEVIHG
jgi:serine phosphatase RsbU (regulator of sigma subunit)/anti-sigma regulatory factor (Ser/Thr protein kinase)